jgi:hypothetical protein
MNETQVIDFDKLLKFRLIIGRFGEMDLARWWNSKGMLGRHGAIVLQRGFPTTHYFAQARVVFAIARSRCNELFNPPGCMTLWSLPAEIEDRFEEQWQMWLDQGEDWSLFFQNLANTEGNDLLKVLSEFQLISSDQTESVSKLRRSAEGRAVPLPGTYQPNDEIIALLAAGFARGEQGNPAIPYARLEE